jgi:hypothetical protein
MGDGKARNVLEYLDNLIEKGKATSGAITPLKTAFAKVAQVVDGDTWDQTDVRSIDVEDYMARFANLTMGKYASDSLVVYKSRINKVINWYIQFLDKPGWTPDVLRRNITSKSTPPKAKVDFARKVVTVNSPQLGDAPLSMPEIANVANRVLYPYPLTDGQLVHISLPYKLSKIDAKRIGSFIESIAIDDPTIGSVTNG